MPRNKTSKVNTQHPIVVVVCTLLIMFEKCFSSFLQRIEERKLYWKA